MNNFFLEWDFKDGGYTFINSELKNKEEYEKHYNEYKKLVNKDWENWKNRKYDYTTDEFIEWLNKRGIKTEYVNIPRVYF